MLLATPLGLLLGGPKRILARTLGLATAALVIALPLLSDLEPAALWGGIAICVVALVPAQLWCAGYAPGLPVFPVFAATHVWAFGLPLLTAHPIATAYPPAQIAMASATVCGFLALATLVWLGLADRRPGPTEPLRVLDTRSGQLVVWLPLVAAPAIGLLELAGHADLFGAGWSIVRASVTGLNTLSVFVLCLQWGSAQLPARLRPILGALLILQLVVAAAALLLVGAMTVFLIAVVAFTAGRGRAPVLVVLLALVAFAFLHVGKGVMRERHWRPEQELVLQPADLPGWYAERAAASVAASGGDLAGNLLGRQREGAAPLWWRSSTMQLLLLAQDLTPREVPFLQGATYEIIPALLVPRILNPTKLRTHEGTYRLNLHYGLQREEDTWTTTIGWGLLNEAFANFGYWGVAGLAAVLGGFFGWVTRYSAAGSLLSLRALFAILVLSYAFQAEFSAGVLVSALFQSSAALVALSFLIMRREWLLDRFARRGSEE